MQGFINRRIPLFLRRLVTMLPALVVLAIGLDATDVLVISQVVLSFGIPFALVPMILLTRRARRDGRAREPARDDDRGVDGGDADHPAQRLPAVAHVLRLSRALRVAAERLGRWLDRWAEAHGGVAGTETGARVVATAADGAVVECEPPFPPVAGDLLAHVTRERTVGVLLVRLGGHAAGVFRGRVLLDSKVDSRLVHGRHRAGGSSANRFARRRAGQARVALQAAADVAVRVLARPAERGELEAVVLGGDRRALGEVLEDPRLAAVRGLAVERVLEVGDPRLKVREATPDQFLATIVRPR